MKHITEVSRDPRITNQDRDEIVGRVYTLVRDWERGMPLVEVRRSCTARERGIAIRCTAVDHPMRPGLMRMLRELSDSNPTGPGGPQIRTRHGYYGEADIRRAGGRVDTTTGGPVVQFPIRTPDSGPVYARDAEERWSIANGVERGRGGA